MIRGGGRFIQSKAIGVALCFANIKINLEKIKHICELHGYFNPLHSRQPRGFPEKMETPLVG